MRHTDIEILDGRRSINRLTITTKHIKWMGIYKKRPVAVKVYKPDKKILVDTEEGMMTADVGDYLIIGLFGEVYPIKADIFKETYTKVKVKE